MGINYNPCMISVSPRGLDVTAAGVNIQPNVVEVLGEGLAIWPWAINIQPALIYVNPWGANIRFAAGFYLVACVSRRKWNSVLERP